VVGVLALFVGGWVTVALDDDGGGWSPLAVAVGFIGVVTLLLIPRSSPPRRRRPNTERHETERTSA
jgi:hypothetical protein